MGFSGKRTTQSKDDSALLRKKTGLSSTARMMLALDINLAQGKSLTMEQFKAFGTSIDSATQKKYLPLVRLAGMLRGIDTESIQKTITNDIPAFENALFYMQKLIDTKLQKSQAASMLKSPMSDYALSLAQIKTISQEILKESEKLSKERRTKLENLEKMPATSIKNDPEIEKLIRSIEMNTQRYEDFLNKVQEIPKKLDKLRLGISSSLNDVDRLNFQQHMQNTAPTPTTPHL